MLPSKMQYLLLATMLYPSRRNQFRNVTSSVTNFSKDAAYADNTQCFGTEVSGKPRMRLIPSFASLWFKVKSDATFGPSFLQCFLPF